MQQDKTPQPIQPVVPSDAMAADAIPKHTTPTWESELLLSGATVFGLLQLPSYLYVVIDRLHHQLPTVWDGVVMLGSMLSLSMVYGLIVTFLLHLASRAYWVALVGLQSVYPRGIRWERARGGSIGQAVRKELFGDQDVLIERADNLSTLIFSTGIAIVFNALFAVIISIPPLVLAMALQTWVWPLPDAASWFLITMALLVVPLVLPRLLDNAFGSRLAADGAFARLLATSQRKVAMLGPWRMAEPLMLNLTTNMRQKHGFLVFLLLVYALFTVTTASENARRKHVEIFPFPALSRSIPERQLSDYYESAGPASQVLPHVQNDIVAEPYLRLWVPLDPHRSQAFNRACARSINRTPAAPGGALAICIEQVIAPRLDGRPLTGLAWHPYRDSNLGVDGLRTYIPIQALTSGEHELLMLAPARDDAERGDKPESWRIPFWR